MFGHDDNQDENTYQDDGQQSGQQTTPGQDQPAVKPSDDTWQHPDNAPDDGEAEGHITKHEAGLIDDSTASHDESEEPETASVASEHDQPSGSNDDLIDLKQEALTKLSPLVGHLDQTPEEKFRTLMMMIQASDDQSLIRQAYDTALEITDEKIRAQALLDIVNEINYFTQNPQDE